MKLKNESFYDPGARDTGISASEYRKEYTRLYTNYEKRMKALKNNGFSWTQTYKEFEGIPKPSQLKSTRGIRNNLKGLYDFFNNPMTSTRAQQRARTTIIKQFNKAGVPLKKEEYETYMKFLNWLSSQFKNIGVSSTTIYTAYKQAENSAIEKTSSLIYYTFAEQQGYKLKEETKAHYEQLQQNAIKRKKEREERKKKKSKKK